LHQSIHVISKRLWRARFNLKRTLLVGCDNTTLRVKDELSNNPEYGYEVVGYICPDQKVHKNSNFRYLGGINNLDEICRMERIQEVIFVNLESEYEKIILPLIKCRKNLIDVKIISDTFDSAAIDTRMRDFFGFYMINYECKFSYFFEALLKRVFDLSAAIGCGIVLLPFILFIGALLRIKEGKALFFQERVGKDLKTFQMYKFITMNPDPEIVQQGLKNFSQNGPIFNVKDDPRVTSIGSFLRKYNIDEIPQLINVIKGEMSLIGPRPPLPEEVSEYRPWHKARLETLPGMTGMWQVDKKRKWRFDEMVKLDIFYILNWSLILDLKILLQTPAAIIRGTGFRN